MTTQDALKQAVNSLQQAMQIRKQEISDLQKSINDKDQDIKSRLNELKLNEAQSLKGAVETDSSSLTAKREQEALLMRKDESQLADQFVQFKRETDQIINQKQRNVDDIKQTIRMIEQNWQTI